MPPPLRTVTAGVRVDFFPKAGSPGLSNSTEPTSPDSVSPSPNPAYGSPERNLKNNNHAYNRWMDGWMRGGLTLCRHYVYVNSVFTYTTVSEIRQKINWPRLFKGPRYNILNSPCKV